MSFASFLINAAKARLVSSNTDPLTGGISYQAGGSNNYPTGIGRFWCFAGDSITYGNGASNAGSYGFASHAQRMAGPMVVRSSSLNAGHTGDRSDEILTHMRSVQATYSPDAWCIMAGTNDASQGVATAVYESNLRQICVLAKSGNRPFVVCTVTPRSSGTSAAIRKSVTAYNAIINTIVPQYGGIVAQTFDALADVTGYLAAAYDSSDGTHPNDAGHSQLALVVTDAINLASGVNGYRALSYQRSWIRSPDLAITTDALMQRVAVVGGAWWEPTKSGTAATLSMVADTYGVLGKGKWASIEIDGTSAAGTETISSGATTAISVGDFCSLDAVLLVLDTSGDWVANCAAGTAYINHLVVNQAAAGVLGDIVLRSPGMKLATGQYLLHIHRTFTVPAGATGLMTYLKLAVPTGSHYSLLFGEAGIINLTTAGLPQYLEGSAMVYV